ncbi:citrate/2-methylcitrate synthase [Humisphaera borealis]|uniref:Citrate synthase n=1 Tax=Humisphaera borealis TaxID=2807512 RepID=A0A7M2X202_9BACT|nr:citrate/2-methylcitrate synthase [Humisphaera borealis]QOV91694.1 citrate synthase [Humisphaera borealis]
MSESTAATAAAKGGLQGVVAAQSDICFIDGDAGRLVYRGYEIGDLVENASFEETAYLLWDGKLPNKTELATLKQQLSASMALPAHVLAVIKALPAGTQPMDVLRTAVSALAGGDTDLTSNEAAANRRKAVRLTAQFPTIVTAYHRIRNNQQPIAPDPSLSIAGNFLYMLNGKKPHETLVRVMDAALVLHAEHGMNASTFTARVIAATLADMHASITGALGALKGPLHGGANEAVMHLLLQCGDADSAERKIKEMLANKQKVPGFGHRVYRTFDPRATFLRKMSKQLGEAAGNSKWYEMSERLIPILRDTKKPTGEPLGLNPNVDFFSASAYYTMDIPLDLFTPIFGVARVTGWAAHVMEQHKNNRIIRPTDDYTGPFGKKVEPIEQRA